LTGFADEAGQAAGKFQRGPRREGLQNLTSVHVRIPKVLLSMWNVQRIIGKHPGIAELHSASTASPIPGVSGFSEIA
jgi:hypothetical protein